MQEKSWDNKCWGPRLWCRPCSPRLDINIGRPRGLFRTVGCIAPLPPTMGSHNPKWGHEWAEAIGKQWERNRAIGVTCLRLLYRPLHFYAIDFNRHILHKFSAKLPFKWSSKSSIVGRMQKREGNALQFIEKFYDMTRRNKAKQMNLDTQWGQCYIFGVVVSRCNSLQVFLCVLSLLLSFTVLMFFPLLWEELLPIMKEYFRLA